MLASAERGHDVRVVMPMYGADRGRRATPSSSSARWSSTSARRGSSSRCYAAELPGTKVPGLLRPLPRALRPARDLHHGPRRAPPLRRALVGGARASASGSASARTWSTRTTGRPRCCRCSCARCSRGTASSRSTRTVLTIHNIGHQGTFDARVLADIGPRRARRTISTRISCARGGSTSS